LFTASKYQQPAAMMSLNNWCGIKPHHLMGAHSQKKSVKIATETILVKMQNCFQYFSLLCILKFSNLGSMHRSITYNMC